MKFKGKSPVEPILLQTPLPSKNWFILNHLGQRNWKRLQSNNPALASGDKLIVFSFSFSITRLKSSILLYPLLKMQYTLAELQQLE